MAAPCIICIAITRISAAEEGRCRPAVDEIAERDQQVAAPGL